MAINYEQVVWDTNKYVNPTRMNHMDDGIKAACDKVDEHDQKIETINSNLSSQIATENILFDDITISANTPKEITKIASKDGYYPIGILGVYGGNSYVSISRFYIGGDSYAHINLYNNHNSELTVSGLGAMVIFRKN